MGLVARQLSGRKVEQLSKQDGMHAVGGVDGLYLCVAGSGRSWIFRYVSPIDGRRRDHGIGSFSDFTLAEARERTKALRKGVREGVDPIGAHRAHRDALRAATAKRMTFDQCVTAYIEAKRGEWRTAKHRAQWGSTLTTYAGPVIGSLNVADVDTPHVTRILEPIWRTKTETAKRLRGRIERVLAWAAVRGYRNGDNPARWRGHMSELLEKPSTVAKVEHHAALPYREIGAFMKDLRAQSGIGAAALEFAILTAARSGEVRGATWDEISIRARRWTIPAGRMKAKREHVVPLSDAAIAVLKRIEGKKLDGYAFPGAREGKPLSDMSLTAVLRRMERGDVTAHGFRSTFRDWAAEATGYPSEMAEMALAHTIGSKVEAAYRRGNMFEKRVRMMNDWAKWCAKPLEQIADVVPLKRATGDAK